MLALQVSPRVGKLFCKNLGKRVLISGEAVTYLEGSITIKKSVPVNAAIRRLNVIQILERIHHGDRTVQIVPVADFTWQI